MGPGECGQVSRSAPCTAAPQSASHQRPLGQRGGSREQRDRKLGSAVRALVDVRVIAGACPHMKAGNRIFWRLPSAVRMNNDPHCDRCDQRCCRRQRFHPVHTGPVSRMSACRVGSPATDLSRGTRAVIAAKTVRETGPWQRPLLLFRAAEEHQRDDHVELRAELAAVVVVQTTKPERQYSVSSSL